jgi:hypothetical protein
MIHVERPGMYRTMIGLFERIATRREARRLLPRGMARSIARFVHDKENRRSASLALSGRKANLDTIEAFLLAHPVRMGAPRSLASRAQRSVGTLLCELFNRWKKSCPACNH